MFDDPRHTDPDDPQRWLLATAWLTGVAALAVGGASMWGFGRLTDGPTPAADDATDAALAWVDVSADPAPAEPPGLPDAGGASARGPATDRPDAREAPADAPPEVQATPPPADDASDDPTLPDTLDPTLVDALSRLGAARDDGGCDPGLRSCGAGAGTGTGQGDGHAAGLSGGGGAVRIQHGAVTVRRRVDPTYPPAGRGAGDQRCVVDVRIDPRGRPVDLAVRDCPPAFAAASREAVSRWRWHPLRVEGVAVPASFRLAIRYDEAR